MNIALRPAVRPRIDALADSKIREVAAPWMTNTDVIPLWFGEPDLPTPRFICDAASAAMAAGKTQYTPSGGIAELRRALALYQEGLKGRAIDPERIVVTASGMSAIQVVMQSLIDPGDRVVIPHPLWPNAAAVIQAQGGTVTPVLLEAENGVWHLDLEKLFAALGEDARALFLNSPGNPTGWMMTSEQQRQILDYCRRRGIWIIADEVYERIVYEAPVAPSFLSLAEPEDRVIAINSFSKTWCMTGWRLGWVTAPSFLVATLHRLNEFNTSGSNTFVQWAGVTAVEAGEPFVEAQLQRYRRARDLVFQRLSGMRRVSLLRPAGAFYAFFRVDGMKDSLAFAKRLVAEHRVGLAPGTAFGAGGEGHLRLCFASAPETLSRAMDRIETALSKI
ncbi:MAG: pyridoxal phosphate-dependent aminotransferase [Proteobacteria bacterium]|nr:pyridoxal phosphate-dependent aminotransferase [Pseudomonadota bacterium]MBI3499538.1 pyridoxal phosphate-dependent aminotransferase [Pseudomonadota bacterium]